MLKTKRLKISFVKLRRLTTYDKCIVVDDMIIYSAITNAVSDYRGAKVIKTSLSDFGTNRIKIKCRKEDASNITRQILDRLSGEITEVKVR